MNNINNYKINKIYTSYITLNRNILYLLIFLQMIMDTINMFAN